MSEASTSEQINKYLRITAPFSGVITERFILEGTLVGDNASHEPLFKLAQQNRLRLTVAIQAHDIRLQKGSEEVKKGIKIKTQ